MATATAPRRPAPAARDGFGRLLRAEWTKLRSIRRWVLTLAAAGAFTVLVSLLAATGGSSDANRYPDFVTGPAGRPVVDDFYFVHRPLTGDGSIVARVATQANSHEWAAAGVMVKRDTTSGSPYAALMVTPGHGVRLRADFTVDRAGSGGAAPRWLRLVRSGASVTGYESADGAAWREVGSVDVAGLSETAEIGLFVSSPPEVTIGRQVGSSSFGERATEGSATFDHVGVDVATPSPPVAAWRGASVSGPQVGGEGGPGAGSFDEAGGVFTVVGSGEIGPREPPDDIVQISLAGVLVGLMAIVAVAVLFMTSEYRRGMIRTTLAVSRGRGRVLAAKAVVLGVTTFGIGLVACVTSFLVARPILREHGFAPPAFPPPSVSDGPVLRALLGTAVFMALVAVFALGTAAILRRSAVAITVVIMLLLAPTFVGSALPADAGRWLMWLTPAGGFAVQRAKPPTDALVEPWSMISPWTGLGVAAGYAAAALLLAVWLIRRRDA